MAVTAMFALLETTLFRSRQLPFHLEIPQIFLREGRDYTARLLGLKALDVFRLAACHGPARLFRLLNPTCAPLPNLYDLDVFGDPKIETIDLVAQFGARCLPNLRELVAPNIRFPANSAPFGELRYLTLEGNYGHHHRALFNHCPSLVKISIVNSASRTPLPDPPVPLSLEEVSALRSITFAGTYGKHHRALFVHCPHLVRLNITDSTMSTPLPEPPVPPTLQEVSIRSTRQRALSLATLMQYWHGVCLRRLVAPEVYSLRDVLPLFLASHSHAVEMRLPGGGGDVAFSAMPDEDTVWTLSPSPPWAAGFLASIEKPASERLMSISVSFSRLGALLRARKARDLH